MCPEAYLLVACVRRVDPAGKVSKSIKTFATMTTDLLALSDWLALQGVAVVAMESTGSYWKPVFNLLESRFEVVLVNAHHIKQVPGRKTDVKDSEWIAQLLQHGLLRPSFIPPRPTRELRDLTRQRTQLINERTSVINRIQKDRNLQTPTLYIRIRQWFAEARSFRTLLIPTCLTCIHAHSARRWMSSILFVHSARRWVSSILFVHS